MIKLNEITIQKHEQEFEFRYTGKFNVYIDTFVSKNQMMQAENSEVLDAHIRETIAYGLMNHAYGDFKADIYTLMYEAQKLARKDMDNSDLLQAIHRLELKLK